MTWKTKILGIALVVVAVTGLLIYAPLTLAGSRNHYKNEVTPPLQPSDGSRHELLRRFIANATPVEIHGAVVTLVKRMLVLNTANGQVRILLPPTWIAGEKVLEREDLFKTDYLTIEQSIIVKTLKGNIVTKEAYSIYVLFGYEIINASDVHAYAVLPFNIKIP